MPDSDIFKRLDKVVAPYRITKGSRFKLKAFDPSDTRGMTSDQEDEAKDLVKQCAQWLAEEQVKLYAQDRWSVLLIFQGIDASGKDGAIKHIMSGVNPQGCQVHSFKQPSAEELDHDFMWRYVTRLPERGRIGIFNRSYYEEVLVVRVHEQILASQRLPAQVVGKHIWKERLADIAAFEDYLSRQGTLILKFFLNLSPEEQKRRFLERLDDPAKHWKFSVKDLEERAYWNAYAKAFEHAIQGTATRHAPWHIVPADNKWFARMVIAASIVEAIEKLDLTYPPVSVAQREALAQARGDLLKDRSKKRRHEIGG